MAWCTVRRKRGRIGHISDLEAPFAVFYLHSRIVGRLQHTPSARRLLGSSTVLATSIIAPSPSTHPATRTATIAVACSASSFLKTCVATVTTAVIADPTTIAIKFTGAEEAAATIAVTAAAAAAATAEAIVTAKPSTSRSIGTKHGLVAGRGDARFRFARRRLLPEITAL